MKLLSNLLLVALLFAACKKEGPVDPDPLISINDVTQAEGDSRTDFVFRVRLSKPASKEVTFSYKTIDWVAKENVDYEPVSNGRGAIAEGQTETTLTVVVLGNDFKEPDKTFIVELFDLVNAQPSKMTAVGTILNDDDQIRFTDNGYSTPTSYPGYALSWADEFDGNALDPAHWTYELGDGCPNICGWGNNELQTYTNSSENLYLQQGKMVIEAKRQNVGGREYTSSRIITRGKKFFKYGRVDIRALLPEGQGIWPALWMLGEKFPTVGWPACGEIDIMELVGHQPSTTHATVHFGASFANHQFRGASRTLTSGKFSDQFHVFSIIWEENLIEFLLDDVKFYTVTPATTQGQPYPFNDDFFFIFNIAVGGNWPGNPNASTVFPQRMAVDYIRVFQKE